MNSNQAHATVSVPISNELIDEYSRHRHQQRAWFWRIAVPLSGLCWIMVVLAILGLGA